MSGRHEPILRPFQAEYLEALLPPRDALRREMETWAQAHDVPISRPEVGRLLELLARAGGARRILEVGTAIGYGTLCLALGAPEASIVTLDRDRERQQRARGFLERAAVAERVELICGEAEEILAGMAGPLDLIYLDGDKEGYRRCLDLALPKLRVGGMVLADNLLWKGLIAEPPEGEEDPSARAIESFNGYLTMHPQLVSLVLPLADGVGLAVKTRPLMSELGGPF